MRSEAAWLIAALSALALAFVAGASVPALPAALRDARTLGATAPFAFVLLHAVGVMAFVPATAFAVIGGALFGFARGSAYSLAGGSLGAVGAFLVGRYLGRQLFPDRFANLPQLLAVDRAVAADGGRILLLLRLSPVMPFNLLNYALGASSVRLRDFVLAFIGMLPGTLVAAYGGQIAGEALAHVGKAQPLWSSSYYTELGIGAAATVAAGVILARAARRALRNMS